MIAITGTRGTLLEALASTTDRHRDELALRSSGALGDLTWGEYSTRARRLAAGLAGLGVGARDTVALLLGNRVEFYLADLAALMVGAIPVSVYPTSAPEQISFVLSDSEAKLLITEHGLVSGATDFAGHVLVVGDAGFSSLLETEPLAAVHRVEPDDIATIIYTSGTTGRPKGVELSHRSIMSAVAAMADRTGLGDRGRTICWLPMAHIAARCATYYGAIVFGDEVTVCPDPRQIGACLADVHPTWFFGVPRVWEKLKSVVEQLIAELSAAEGAAVGWLINAATERILRGRDDAPVTGHGSGDAGPLLASIRHAIGLDQVVCAQVGAAPIAHDVVAFFHALGVPLTEIYGFTEGIVCCAPDPRLPIIIGSAGPPLAGVQIEIADDGEILVRGGLMMTGYHRQPDTTAKSYTRDGFFRSGDVGAVNAGAVSILDRKKDLIINAAGKNMSPVNIEAATKSGCPLIAHVVAIGDRRPYNVALICLEPEEIGGRSSAAVHADVMAAVIRGNDRLARVEQIKRFAILDSPWLPGGDELTPTLKLKRKSIAAKHTATIDALYAGPESNIEASITDSPVRDFTSTWGKK